MSITSLLQHGLAHELSAPVEPVVRAVAGWANNLHPNKVPDVGELFHLAMRGWITEDYLTQACQYLGVAVQPLAGFGETGAGDTFDELAQLWNRVYWATQEMPTVHEYLELANRKGWEDATVQSGLRKWGYYGDPVRADMGFLRYDVPGPADLVRFSVRHAWEPQNIKDLGYDQEFPGKVIDYWHQCKGLDYKLFTGPFKEGFDKATEDEGGSLAWVNNYAEAGLPEPTWAQMYWYSHWVLPSPAAGYEAMFRLRPDRDRTYDAPEAKGVDFTFEDLTLLLRANDYPPKYRPILAAIAHRLPGVRFIRSFRQTGVYDDKGVYEWAKRWGYTDKDATDIMQNIALSIKREEEKPKACKGCAAANRAYEIGVISRDDLIAQYIAYGVPEDTASEMAVQEDLVYMTKRAAEVIACIKKRFLRGELDGGQAFDALTAFGVVNQRATDYIDDWSNCLTSGMKEASAAKLMQWACKSYITIAELDRRLQNLKFDAPDIAIMKQEASDCVTLRRQKELQAAINADTKAANAKWTNSRRARTLALDAMRDLARSGTPAQLRKWYCEGEITEADVLDRLRMLGWDVIDAGRFIGDCKAKASQGKGSGGGGSGGGGGG